MTTVDVLRSRLAELTSISGEEKLTSKSWVEANSLEKDGYHKLLVFHLSLPIHSEEKNGKSNSRKTIHTQNIYPDVQLLNI
jgi:hypothetical protein